MILNNDDGIKSINTNINNKQKRGGQQTQQEDHHHVDELMDADQVEHLVIQGSIGAVALWLILMLGTYYVWELPEGSIVYLEGPEWTVEVVATVVFTIIIMVSILPYMTGLKGGGKQSKRMSGILIACIVVQGIALLTNAIMAFGLTVVVIDPVTHSRAFLTRYCEWIPLAGLMTFLAEAVDISIKPSTLLSSKTSNHPNTSTIRDAETNNRDDQDNDDDDENENETMISNPTSSSSFCSNSNETPTTSTAPTSMRAAADTRTTTIITRTTSVRTSLIVAWTQCLSASAGLICPLCSGRISWWIFMVLSCALYLNMFRRIWVRRQNLQAVLLRQQRRQQQSSSLSSASNSIRMTAADAEYVERLQFGYKLTVACTIFWTILVVLYFFNMAIHRLLDKDHPLRFPGLAMICDCVFDFLAKAVYMKFIVEVHESVFDESGRARRRLQELRYMLGVLWDSSSDVIVISVRSNNHSGRFTTMISPTFASIYGYPNQVWPQAIGDGGGSLRALVIEQEQPQSIPDMTSTGRSNSRSSSPLTTPSTKRTRKHYRVTSADSLSRSLFSSDNHSFGGQNDEWLSMTIRRAYLVNDDGDTWPFGSGRSSGINASLPSHQQPQQQHQKQIDIDIAESSVQEAVKIIEAIWNCDRNDAISLHEMVKLDQKVAKCELKISSHSSNAIIGLLQDNTERYQLGEAEQRAALETLARQKDAQSVNRFTRHEVKNGLLASIELCENLRTSLEISCSEQPSSTAKEQDASACMIRLISLVSSVSERVAELDTSLHDILETVLTEAMARDVIHEVYQPKMERMDILATLNVSSVKRPKLMSTSSVGGGTDRFQIVSRPKDFPKKLMMDPQLLKYIHRNAVSNACKYGKQNGRITTEISYDTGMQLFEMKVINLPGTNHADLVEMGKEACQAVFRKGRRLHAELEAHNRNTSHSAAVSTGDGAWIMQKCAYTLGGSCGIEFLPSRTVLTFQCLVEPATEETGSRLPWGDAEKFVTPAGTWGIAVDDSGIQRKLLDRILGHAGVDKTHRLLLGQSADEVRNLTMTILQVVRTNPNSKVLILMDENLDIVEDGVEVLVSGSSCLVDLLDHLTPPEKGRILALVRSANDSDEDTDVYLSRSHGLFPKAPMKPERVRECLSEAWFRRFYQSATTDPSSFSLNGSHHSTISSISNPAPSRAYTQIKNSLSVVGTLISEGVTQARWPKIWKALDILHQSLMSMDNPDSDSDDDRGDEHDGIIATNTDHCSSLSPKLRMVTDLIRGMNRSAVPSDFSRKWSAIKDTVLDSLRRQNHQQQQRASSIGFKVHANDASPQLHTIPPSKCA